MRFCSLHTLICFGIAKAALSVSATSFDPPGLFLTFAEDPSTSMVIDWQTEEADQGREILHWRGVDDAHWNLARGQEIPFPFSDRMIHRVALSGLEPGSEYVFHFGIDSRVFRFRTLPDNFDRPLRLIFGGDTRHRQEWMEAVNREALKLDPDLIVWGGDLAYADGREDRIDRWYEWFDANKNTLIHDDGRVVPILVGVGNHEVRRGYWYRQIEEYATAGDLNAHREIYAPYFFSLFAFPGQPGFATLDLGDKVSIIMLDSDHLNPVAGAQTYWLQEMLDARQEVPWVIPVYHVPAWPSVRDFAGRTSRKVRENWVPLFERYNVRIAFENHDHVYKRTEPIRGDEVTDPTNGIVYLGDGAWGVGVRQTHDVDETWYLARAEAVRHLILMTIHDESRADILVVDEDGNRIDEYRLE